MAAKAKIGQYLRFMDWQNTLDCLHFEHKFSGDDDVHPITTIKSHVLIDDWQWYLPRMGNAALF